ncbi:MAG: hypothetical protein O2820_15490 [Planctomycetota bacterium]|nr:hypothetical protein [Planctomycetota bacterium]MDA1250620.1 hypothetical protein [Planctomycetota bacterium]
MDGSCFVLARQFKSPVRVVVAVLLRSRQTQTQARRARDKALEIRRLRQINDEQQRLISRLREQFAHDRSHRRRLELENDRLPQQPPVLPDDPPLAHLTPPGSRPKARFMNLAATLKWANMVL